ncbi:hypothetical protein FOCC_FOCC001387 [Frankliniella occidentalis]|nr:hypothetical protein FOCC_FOCC001387 [Frankliniella occidentalis]
MQPWLNPEEPQEVAAGNISASLFNNSHPTKMIIHGYASGMNLEQLADIRKERFKCDHHRAPMYFAESIRSESGFWGWSCSSISDYEMGRCPARGAAVLAGQWLDRRRQELSEIIDVDDPNSLWQSSFDPKRPTRIVTHGWRSSSDADVVQIIKSAYLEMEDCNVIGVDWSPLASSKFYPWAKSYTNPVGRRVSELVKMMVGEEKWGADGDRRRKKKKAVGTDKGRAKLKDIHLLGHSLGAHLMGYAGQHLRPHKVSRITEACSHGRSYQFFAESIRSKDFVGLACDSWEGFQNGSCAGGPTAVMGEHTSPGTRGVFYLNTMRSAPFALGERGARSASSAFHDDYDY